MTLGSLRGRLRSLSVDQLVQVRTYEKAHADRLPVVTMLDNRIAKLATRRERAAPSGPVSTSPAPEQLAAGGAAAGQERQPGDHDRADDQPAVAGRPDQPGAAPLARSRQDRPSRSPRGGRSWRSGS